ncbi:alpha/beta fold hydrolase [Brevibacillus choshinensis]|uniref:Alpha/beta hydrolase n=1 Tax=Brevibacillus choshinensis TaxID=54911 RepID=A0ABX7FVB3_BRECH|nr:alpha/beta hydrolase [Brevibacillus choshinensis]QRG69232.1 alpha/beta hydrolase [Brevibacillus choshinensis]
MAQPKELLIQANENVSFAVKVAGQGEPVVYLHGAGGLAWDPFLEGLSHHYQVFAPHLPGTGRSSGLENIRDLWDLILCHYDLFDRLGLDAATVIGHSLGGMIGLELAATDQSRIKQLVAICPAGLFKEEEPVPDMFAMLPHELADLMVADSSSPAAEMLRYVPSTTEERIEATIQRMQNLQAAAKFLWPIPDKGLKHRIHRIKAPTLFIWGRQDRFMPVSYADDFCNRIPHAKLALIDQAAHLVTLEQTGQVLTAIQDFLHVTEAHQNMTGGFP